MDKIDEPRRAKRKRNNDTYEPCPCYRCQGDLQLPATIADHRKRFRWPASPSSSPRACSPAVDDREPQDVNRGSPLPQTPPLGTKLAVCLLSWGRRFFGARRARGSRRRRED
ncbi:unnamed protein product [Rhizoctonia solani]|uniref:Uncharacterized protein n=1 Tax=Rhizoctonia solani TaxID=456999 RepID=A0A8H2WXE9_9AGAM|nr:unnamed protein product [Rhizoctonia solani]